MRLALLLLPLGQSGGCGVRTGTCAGGSLAGTVSAVLIPIWLLVAVGLSLIALHWVLTRRQAHEPPTPHRARSSGTPSIVRSVGSGSLAAVALVGGPGCAEGLAAAGRCAPSTISTVISAIANNGKVPPERVLDAGACWLERAEGKPVDDAPVDELRSAVEAHDAEQAAAALTTCHKAAPSVVEAVS